MSIATAAIGSKSKYYTQFNGLRGISALIVIWEHWCQLLNTPTSWYTFGEGLGNVGVFYFFTMSGFLITGILLRARDKAPTVQAKLHELKQFYVRRILRIFPLYFTVVLGVTAIGFTMAMVKHNPAWRHAFWADGFRWFTTFTTNIFVFVRQDENVTGSFAHLWTMSVEEQFYLLWPLTLMFIPARWLKLALVGTFVIAPVFRICMTTFLPQVKYVSMLPMSNWDTVGIGAMLAYMNHYHGGIPRRTKLIMLGSGIAVT